MNSLSARRQDGKIILEVDEARFLADATHRHDRSLTVTDPDRFIDFALRHVFTLSHDVNREGEHPAWWQRLTEALAQAAAFAGEGVRAPTLVAATCGCDPETHDGG